MKKETIKRIRDFTIDRDWDQFHSPANLAKSISIEANELLECFQWDEKSPLEVPGISLETFIRSAIQQRTGERVKLFHFQKELQRCMELLDMKPEYAKRDLNVGFSGGERKKSEILQLLMLKPDFAILDETDSGLDVDAVRVVAKGIEEYRKLTNGSLLIITHTTKILEGLNVDHTHVLVKGHIVKTGDGQLFHEINEKGFEEFIG